MRAQGWITYRLSRHRRPVSHPTLYHRISPNASAKIDYLQAVPVTNLTSAIRNIVLSHLAKYGPKDGLLTVYPAIDLLLAIRILYCRVSLYGGLRVEYLRSIPPSASCQLSDQYIVASRQMRMQRFITYALFHHQGPVSHPNVVSSRIAICGRKG